MCHCGCHELSVKWQQLDSFASFLCHWSVGFWSGSKILSPSSPRLRRDPVKMPPNSRRGRDQSRVRQHQFLARSTSSVKNDNFSTSFFFFFLLGLYSYKLNQTNLVNCWRLSTKMNGLTTMPTISSRAFTSPSGSASTLALESRFHSCRAFRFKCLGCLTQKKKNFIAKPACSLVYLPNPFKKLQSVSVCLVIIIGSDKTGCVRAAGQKFHKAVSLETDQMGPLNCSYSFSSVAPRTEQVTGQCCRREPLPPSVAKLTNHLGCAPPAGRCHPSARTAASRWVAMPRSPSSTSISTVTPAASR